MRKQNSTKVQTKSSPSLSDLSKKEYRRLEQMVLARESQRIQDTPADTIKQAVVNILDHFPMLIWNVVAEIDRMQGRAN